MLRVIVDLQLQAGLRGAAVRETLPWICSQGLYAASHTTSSVPGQLVRVPDGASNSNSTAIDCHRCSLVQPVQVS